MMLQIETVISAMFIAFLIVTIANYKIRRSRMTMEQRAKEDAEPFDDAW